jgi:hypothetical protein
MTSHALGTIHSLNRDLQGWLRPQPHDLGSFPDYRCSKKFFVELVRVKLIIHVARDQHRAMCVAYNTSRNRAQKIVDQPGIVRIYNDHVSTNFSRER